LLGQRASRVTLLPDTPLFRSSARAMSRLPNLVPVSATLSLSWTALRLPIRADIRARCDHAHFVLLRIDDGTATFYLRARTSVCSDRNSTRLNSSHVKNSYSVS